MMYGCDDGWIDDLCKKNEETLHTRVMRGSSQPMKPSHSSMLLHKGDFLVPAGIAGLLEPQSPTFFSPHFLF